MSSVTAENHYGRVVVVQFGDYGDAVKRFAQGGKENYYAQHYSVDVIAGVAKNCERLTVITIGADLPEELLPNGVHAMGIHLYPPGHRPRFGELLAELGRLEPDRLIVATPLHLVLAWGLRNGVDTLPMFFDSFHAFGLRARVAYSRLAGLLKSPHFRWVANHSIAAAADLVRIGVPANKVVPIDWPAFDSPAGRPTKALRQDGRFEVIFVGQISVAKGAKDLLQAIDQLNRESPHRQYFATFIGKDIGEEIPDLARASSFPERLRFVGQMPHDQIVEQMAAHDAVVVPSRHEYPEGMPMTIYESFCSRSPLVASDHPMFTAKLMEGYNCVTFAASSTASLAGAIRRLSNDAALYASLSENTVPAAADHFCPLKYHQVIESWLARTSEADAFLASHTMAREPLKRTPSRRSGNQIALVHSNPVAVSDGRLLVDRKFHVGMLTYAERMKLPCCSLNPQLQTGQMIMDPIEVSLKDIPYRIEAIETDRRGKPSQEGVGRIRNTLAGSRLVYGTGLHSYTISRELKRTFVSVQEYDLQTRLTVATSTTRNPLRRANRIAHSAWHYRMHVLPEIAGADAVHCNGFPIFDVSAIRNDNTLLYLDSRMSGSMMIGEAMLEARLASLGRRRLRLLYSGRFERMKGADDAVRVAIECLRQGLDIEMHCFGQGYLREEMQQLVQAAGFADRIVIHDAVSFPELVVISQGFDLFVCCHIQNDPSCTYLESMGAGLPIVGYGNRMWRRLCEVSGAGSQSPVGQPVKVAADIRRLASQPAQLAGLSRMAVDFARNHTFEIEFGKRVDSVNSML